MRVKFVGFYEYCAEDTDKCIAKFAEVTAEREKKTGKFPNLIFGPFTLAGEKGYLSGFAGYETDDQGQLDNLTAFYIPEMMFKFTPIEDQSKMIEHYMKMKK